LEKLQAYVAYVKSAFQPKLSPDASKVLSKYYQMQRKADLRNAARTTVRLLEALIRLSQAHARLLFRDVVLVPDAIVSVTLVESSMQTSALLGVSSALHSAFPIDADAEYARQEKIVLKKLGLEHLSTLSDGTPQSGNSVAGDHIPVVEDDVATTQRGDEAPEHQEHLQFNLMSGNNPGRQGDNNDDDDGPVYHRAARADEGNNNNNNNNNRIEQQAEEGRDSSSTSSPNRPPLSAFIFSQKNRQSLSLSQPQSQPQKEKEKEKVVENEQDPENEGEKEKDHSIKRLSQVSNLHQLLSQGRRHNNNNHNNDNDDDDDEEYSWPPTQRSVTSTPGLKKGLIGSQQLQGKLYGAVAKIGGNNNKAKNQDSDDGNSEREIKRKRIWED